MFQGLLTFFLFIDQISFSRSIYNIFPDFTSTNTASEWINSKTSSLLPIYFNQIHQTYIGQDPTDQTIEWKRSISMSQTNKVYIYLEFSIFGQWSNTPFQVYANDLLAYKEPFTLTDTSITSQTISNFNSYVFLVLEQKLETLNLIIQANQYDLGLHINNLLIMQQTQVGKDKLISYKFDIIPQCPSNTYYCQYYCNCTTSSCAPLCTQNQLLDYSTNTCYTVEHCDDCEGDPAAFTCDDGYYAQLNHLTQRYKCVSQCSNNEFSNWIAGTCDDMQTHLQQYVNQNYPVEHYFFFKDIPDFLHFFLYPDIIVYISSTPNVQKERYFNYYKNQFIVGSLISFQEQQIELVTEITTQHQLIFRATANFIDFYPSQMEININGFTQVVPILQNNIVNQGNSNLDDYIAYIDYVQKRDLSPAPTKNVIQIKIKQPLQNGKYQGYFYLEDIHFFQLQCRSGCSTCYSIEFCPPCNYPLHKNPLDCSCETGYSSVNDQCVPCPSYCNYCVAENKCFTCKESTKRINPPACNVCSDSYYLQSDLDDCQPCIQGCKICSNFQTCQQCLPTYFRSDSNKCVKTCPSYQFQDNSDINDPKCTNCNSNCLTCQNTATNCTGCSLDSLLIDNQCYKCEKKFYLSNKICIDCIPNCSSCKSQICDLCEDPYFYKSSTNQCVAPCDSGYYGNFSNRVCTICHQSCVTCIGGTQSNCLSCNQQKVLNLIDEFQGECSSNCYIGSYKIDGRCAKCWKGCKSCIDQTQACLACAKNYYRLEKTGFCYDDCPEGYFNQKSTGYCGSCHIRCKTCSNPENYSCVSCASPLSYFDNRCLDKCPDGYGDQNQVCVNCVSNCKNCFGTEIDQCLECSNGYYYLKNQCYERCPKNYNGIKPQYVCKCIYDNCITCSSNEFFLNNICYQQCPNGYFGFNGLCIVCHYTCKTCNGESEENCVTCQNNLIFYQNQCISSCYGNTYSDDVLNQCLPCNETCLACSGPLINNCTACKSGQVLQTTGTCSDNCLSKEYLVFSEQRCYTCHISCKTCFGSTYQQCLTCDNLFYLNECVDACPSGFKLSDIFKICEPDFSIVIPQCSYQCYECSLTPRFCSNCAANRFQNAPSCDCKEGYYDDGTPFCKLCDNKCQNCYGSASNCIKCKGDRLLPQCECPVFTYDDMVSIYCQLCQDNCKTCDQNGCLTCKGDRIQSPDCLCSYGYFESYKYLCELCDDKCDTCVGTAYICLTCSGLRVKPPSCQCPTGYYDQGGECEQCDPTCIECYFRGCITCFGNRVGPDEGQCNCKQPEGISRLSIGSLYCTDCNLGVPDFNLNKDFTGFKINFGGLTFFNINSNLDVCSQIFDHNTLTILGSETICDNEFNVIFGSTSSIQVGDIIQLLPAFILDGCKTKFNTVLQNKLQIPTDYNLNEYLPQIQFNENTDQNICDDTIIMFTKLFFNGNQQFKILQWNLKSPESDQNYTKIQQYLNLAIQNQSDFVKFPPQTFAPDNIYIFELQIQSFANLVNSQKIFITTQARSQIFFKPFFSQNNQTFYRYNEIVIDSMLQYKNCFEKNPPQQLLTYNIVFKPTKKILLEGNFSEDLIDGFFSNIQLKLPAYHFNFSIPLTFVFVTVLSRSDYTVKYSYEQTINLIRTTPILTIQGGNQIIGFTEKLSLIASMKDIDYSEQETLNEINQCFWTCVDIISGAACQNQQSEIIEFNSLCNQSLPPRTFPPYSVVIFQVSIIKADVEYTKKVAIQVVESNLPVLTVEGPSKSKTHNYYDEILFKLIYPGINPDDIMYAGAVIYDSVVQATFEFYYLEFKFKIQNYFTDFQSNISNFYNLRLSIYDPRFILPSISNQVFIMNIPPKNCQLLISSPQSFVEFYDELTVTVNNCQDENLPLQYSMVIFPNMSIYQQNIITSRFYDQILISPYQDSNNFYVRLPYFSKKDIIIVVLIQDTEGGISNVTTTLQVKELLNFNSSEQIEEMIISQDFNIQLIMYNLITERFKQVEGMLSLKDKIFRQLIYFNNKQSYSNNQTEKIFCSISNLLMKNQSLLGINVTLDLQQLNNSILQAYTELKKLSQLQQEQNLNSKDNLEKNILLKLYVSFMNILSSWIDYRILQKKDSTDIQDLLKESQAQIQSVSVANEPLYQVFTSSVDLNFGFLTEKLANSVTGAKINGNASTNNASLYQFSMTRFNSNPYQTTKEFPQNSTNYSVVVPSIKASGSDQNVDMKNDVNFKFPVQQKINTTQKCISQGKNKDWSVNSCKTKTVNNEVICQCDELTPTSIMDQLNFIAGKAEDVFSLDTFLKFGSFPFHKTVIFYFYVFLTLGYIYAAYWGIKADSSMLSKVEVEFIKEDVEDPLEQQVIFNQNEQQDHQQSQFGSQSQQQQQPQSEFQLQESKSQPQSQEQSQVHSQSSSQSRAQQQTQQPQETQKKLQQQSLQQYYEYQYQQPQQFQQQLEQQLPQLKQQQEIEAQSQLQNNQFYQEQQQSQPQSSQIQRHNIFQNASSFKDVLLKAQSNFEEQIITINPQPQNLQEIEKKDANNQSDQKKFQRKNTKGLKTQLIGQSVSSMQALLEYMKFFHQILQIFYKFDKTKPRGLRATIIYTSILGGLAVIFIFNQPDNMNFNAALMLLTAPANKIYQITLEKLLSHEKRVVRIIGIIFMIISSALISYVMLAGLVMMDSVETANKWSAIFLASIFSDNIIYSPIQLVIQYLIQMEFIKLPLFKKLLEKILDDAAKEFLYGLANAM